VRPENIILVVLCALAFIFGVADQFFYPEHPFPPTAVAHSLINMALVFSWYWFDSNRLGYKRTPLLSVAVILIAFLALPYYFFRSRGVKKGFIYLGLMLLFFLVFAVSTLAGMVLAQFVQK
jgi:prepilin signal peptidase PulO-like enzyme (type II secretory pathway)